MALFKFVDPYSLLGAMTTYSGLGVTPLTCLEDQPHYVALIAHTPPSRAIPGTLWKLKENAPLHLTFSYNIPILHSPSMSLQLPHQPSTKSNQWGPHP